MLESASTDGLVVFTVTQSLRSLRRKRMQMPQTARLTVDLEQWLALHNQQRATSAITAAEAGAMRLSKNVRILILAALLLPGVYALNYFVTPDLVGIAELEVSCRPRGTARFDSDIWRQASASSGNRYQMVDDLLATEKVIGLDSTQIAKLLGKPDLVSDKDGEKLLFHILGDQRTHPSKSVWFPGLFPNNDRWMLYLTA